MTACRETRCRRSAWGSARRPEMRGTQRASTVGVLERARAHGAQPPVVEADRVAAPPDQSVHDGQTLAPEGARHE